MTVLRSREILSTADSKGLQQLSPENVVVEPATPSKTSEFLNQSSNSTTPSSSSVAETCGHVELGLESSCGSKMVLKTGTVRRRSARLATKLGISEELEYVEEVSGKRKKVESNTSNGKIVARNLETRVLDLKLEVKNSGGAPEASLTTELSQNLGDGGVTELVRELRYDMETSGVETVNNGTRKRKLNMEVKSLGLESLDLDEKGFLSLRSGKRVVNREMKDGYGCAGNGLEGTENIKRSGIVLGDDVLVETRLEASTEDQTGSSDKRRFSEGEKGKGKVGSETLVTGGSVPVNLELDDRVGQSLLHSNIDAINLPKRADSEMIVKHNGCVISEISVMTRGRLSKEEKGKMKLGVNDSSSTSSNRVQVKVENVDGSGVSGSVHPAANEALQDGDQVAEADVAANDARRDYRERFRSIARRNASRFAHFSSQDELGNRAPDVAGRESPVPETDRGIEDWPGPFSTAMKIIKDREAGKHGARHGSFTSKSEAVAVKWIARRHETYKHQKQVPSLQDLCLSILSKNSDAITSLDFVPDVLRHKICWFLCDGRKMDAHFLELLVHGSPTEIRVRDCSWLSEELFTKIFEGCNTSKLTVLQFDHCGVCMPDYILYSTLAHSPNSLPALTAISLKGAYRLSDAGLSMLVSSAPSLKSIDISQCPLLTAEGICSLANSLRFVLRELYLDNSPGIDAMIILPALLKLENLEVLSLAGIQTVCDDFIRGFFSAHGCKMKELVLADCMELTDASLEVIGDACSELHAIDLTNLWKLTDVSIGHLANGCQAIQMLKLCRNAFSDEAIAAYLDVRGAFLKDLSLNNIIQVANHTALSLARNCRNLRNLDLSWCRNLTNEAMGLIVDSCTSLEVLKLFGCSQITNVFLDGYSNPQVKLIGLKMTPVFKHIKVPDFLLGPLRYSTNSP